MLMHAVRGRSLRTEQLLEGHFFAKAVFRPDHDLVAHKFGIGYRGRVLPAPAIA